MTSGPGWARGLDIPRLKEITGVFAEHDTGMVHGPFGRYSETDAATDLSAGRLHVVPAEGRPEVAWIAHTPKTTIAVKDFTGTVRDRVGPGRYYVTRMAWRPGREPGELVEVLEESLRPPVVWAWQEHPGERALMADLGLRCSAVKVSAASEMRGLYRIGASPAVAPAEAVTIGQLDVTVPDELRTAVLDRFADAEFADHYSGYNRKRAWSALALRGFWPNAPDRIEKPAEMNKRWKTDNPGALGAVCGDTPLMCPEVAAILSLIPAAGFERVRLMRLSPGGGELTRHADITDPDAGTGVGRVARIHVPLETNPECVFRSWSLDGRPDRVHMAPGGVYYLDTRKPHTAVNGGAAARVHLVGDAVVSPELQALIAASTTEGIG